MNITYRNPLIKQLRDQQVRVTSRDKKLEHVNRAEKLLAEVEPGRSYPYDYLCYRITEYRPDTAVGVSVPGKELAHDLRLFVEDVSDSAKVKAEDADLPGHALDELRKMFNVSSSSISRLHEAALVGR